MIEMVNIDKNEINERAIEDAAAAAHERYLKMNNDQVIESLVTKGIIKKNLDGTLKMTDPDAGKTTWKEDEARVEAPYHISVKTDMNIRTMAEINGHRYEIVLPSAWRMESRFMVKELTNRERTSYRGSKYKTSVTINVFSVSIGEVMDILRGKASPEDLPKEVIDALHIMIQRNWKKISL